MFYLQEPQRQRLLNSWECGASVAKLFILISLSLLILSGNEVRAQVICGDFLCACGSDESGDSCPSDCGDCGDLICDPYEDTDSCPSDCGPCGDLLCDGAETNASCPEDCPDLCGDLICDPGEVDCPSDCGDSIVACEATPEEPTPSPSVSPSASPSSDPTPSDSPGPDDGDGDGDGNGGGGNNDPLSGAEFGGGGGCSLNVRN